MNDEATKQITNVEEVEEDDVQTTDDEQDDKDEEQVDEGDEQDDEEQVKKKGKERAERNTKRLEETDQDPETVIECGFCGTEMMMSQSDSCENWRECGIAEICWACCTCVDEEHQFFICPLCVSNGVHFSDEDDEEGE